MNLDEQATLHLSRNIKRERSSHCSRPGVHQHSPVKAATVLEEICASGIGTPRTRAWQLVRWLCLLLYAKNVEGNGELLACKYSHMGQQASGCFFLMLIQPNPPVRSLFEGGLEVGQSTDS